MTARPGSPLAALATIEVPAWVVGGAVRDDLLGRPTADYDVAVGGDVRSVAERLARVLSAHRFQLSGGFGAWRVVSREHLWNIDLLPLAGNSIEADLARRDFTVNAMARALPEGEVIDPFGGMQDLAQRRLRMVASEAFAQDPLRSLRLVRLLCELGFETEPETVVQAQAAAPALNRIAPERVFAELRRIISSDRAVVGMGLIDELRIMPVVLPELSALQGVGQSPYHHLDVYDHTMAVLGQAIELERAPEAHLGSLAQPLSEYMAEPLANELNRWQALRLGAILHDIAKPQTRQSTEEGRVTFLGHDAAGSELAHSILVRLRASDRLAEHVAALARNHLRLGFLVHEMPLSRRAVYRYLRACEPIQVDVTVLSMADRLATRGRGSEEAIARHLGLARQMLGEALGWVAARPKAPIRGDELAAALGITPGPELGLLLAELEEATFAGEVGSPQDAVARARELLKSRSIGSVG